LKRGGGGEGGGERERERKGGGKVADEVIDPFMLLISPSLLLSPSSCWGEGKGGKRGKRHPIRVFLFSPFLGGGGKGGEGKGKGERERDVSGSSVHSFLTFFLFFGGRQAGENGRGKKKKKEGEYRVHTWWLACSLFPPSIFIHYSVEGEEKERKEREKRGGRGGKERRAPRSTFSLFLRDLAVEHGKGKRGKTERTKKEGEGERKKEKEGGGGSPYGPYFNLSSYHYPHPSSAPPGRGKGERGGEGRGKNPTWILLHYYPHLSEEEKSEGGRKGR